jgi:DMSO/TMAO reductase YedYZ heme-binding membrane subunit
MLAAATGPSAYWYLTRGTGVVALLLLTTGLVLGVLTSTRWAAPRWPRFVVSGLHRSVTLFALAFVVVHVLTTILDGYAPVGLKDAIIPFASRYRPIWVGFGAVAFDLLLALILTSLLRARVGFRAWRYVHWLAYASWPLALVHAFGTGSDARSGWFGLLALLSIGSVISAVLWRVIEARTAPGSVRVAGASAALVVPAIVGIWALGGPLHSGWAARAGTPPNLLGARSAQVTKLVTVGAGPQLPAAPYDASLSGQVSESSGDSEGLVTVGLDGSASGGSKGVLHVDLRGVPLEGGGIQMTGSSVTFGPPGSPQAYSGRIVSLQGSQLVASVSDANGNSLALQIDLQLDQSSRTFSGSLHVT